MAEKVCIAVTLLKEFGRKIEGIWGLGFETFCGRFERTPKNGNRELYTHI